MKKYNLIFVANELANNNLNGPNVVFFNLIKTIYLNKIDYDKFNFYFLVPSNFKLYDLDINFIDLTKKLKENKDLNFIKLKKNNKLEIFLNLLRLSKFVRDYIIFYPRLTFLPFLNNQISFLYDLPLEKSYIMSENQLKDFIDKQFLFKKFIINNLKFIFTISNSVREDIIKFLGIDKLDYVYLGVDHEVFKPLKINEVKKILEKHNLRFKNYFFYPAGKLWFRKNIINLLLAFHKLINNSYYKDIELVITTNNYNDLRDKYVYQVREVVNKYNLEEKVKFLFVDSKDLVSLYNGAIAVVFSSYYEGFGLPILESLACKIPILFSDIPVFNEIFPENPFKFKPNSIENIYFTFTNFLDLYLKKEKESINRIIELGYKKILSFRWDNTIKNLLSKVEKNIFKE
jgi:hypothetical protein